MVTADEIAGVTIFAGLDAADAGAARARGGRHHASGRASTRRTRATSARSSRVLEGRIEAVKIDDGIETVVGERAPGRRLRRGPDHARHRVPRRVPRRRGVARDAHRAARLPRASRPRRRTSRSRSAGSPAYRMGGPGGLQGLAAKPHAAARDRDRAPLGRVVRRAPPLPRSQPDRLPVAAARRPGRCRAVVGGRCRPTATIRRSASSTARPWSSRSRGGSPSSSGSRPRRQPPSTTP